MKLKLFQIYFNEINLNILKQSDIKDFIQLLNETLTQIKSKDTPKDKPKDKSRYDQIKLLNRNLEVLLYYQQKNNLEEIEKILTEIEKNYNNLFDLLTPEYITGLIEKCQKQLPKAQPDDDDEMSFAGGYKNQYQISYKEKYIKYKLKYLNLKKIS